MNRVKRMVRRVLCYVLCLILMITGICTTSFAESSSNADTSIGQKSDVQVMTDEMIGNNSDVSSSTDQNGSSSEGENALNSELLSEEYESQNVVSNIDVNITGDMDKSINLGLKWNPVNNAESYIVTLNGDVVISDLNETHTKFSITMPEFKEYAVTVSAIKKDEKFVASELSHKDITINLSDFVAKDVVVKLDTMRKTSGTSQKEYRSWSTPKVNDKFTTVTVNPDVTVEWKEAAYATEYKLIKYVTDSKGNVNSSYEGVTPEGKFKTETSYWYREYVEEPVFSKQNSGYYSAKVFAKSSFEENNIKIDSEVYSTVGKYTSLEKKTYSYFFMNKFLDDKISEDNRTYIKGSSTGRNYNGERASTVRTIKFYAKTNTRAKYYVKGSGNAGKGWLSKGVYGWTQGGSGSKFEFYTNSGKHGYVMRKKLTCYKVDYSPYVDWTADMKESYVNSKSSFKSNRTYMIWISRYTQTINVFKKDSSGKWRLTYLAECTTGKFRNYTSSGDKKIHKRIKHRVRSKHHYYYLNCFNGLNSMHGPTYYKSSGLLKSNPSSHLGNNAMSSGTLGCVRTWNTDAKWVWDHCGIGTKVVVY